MINPKVYHSLGLKDDEYLRIKKILKRDPTITELAMFSVEWSEHCGYCSSKSWIKLFPKKGKIKTLLSEDAGGIILGNLAIVFKMESHNHPSQVEPKQGAATGVGGIIRDIFACGARPIALFDSLRFGNLENPHNRYIAKGVVSGISFYGNCVGIPTVGGDIYFDNCYNNNCLVNVMCIGIAERKNLMRAKATGKGNSIIYVGASTGRDGIGGCSILASDEFKEDDKKRPSVQIGDPFLEKCLIEATLEAISTGYIVGLKDMGAAGLTCSISEMAASGNSGIEVDISLIPKRESGMQAWEIMMSESQERMLLCIKKGKEKEIIDIFSKWDLNATVIGKVTDDGFVVIKDKDKIIAKIPAKELVNPPIYKRKYKEPDYLKKIKKVSIKKLPKIKDYNSILFKLISNPTVASKKWVYEQYDYMVGTNTVLVGSDAAVLRIKGTDKAIAATVDCNSTYCYLNPYMGAQIAVAESIRNLACVGADAVAITDCLNFGNPTKPDKFWQFKESVRGIISAAKFFKLPVVSGNVSFYNESPKGSIYPTPTIGMVGILDDVSLVVSQDFKNEGDYIILLGITKEEFGGSLFLKEIYSKLSKDVPTLNLKLEKKVVETVLGLIKNKLINSAHDCSEGGFLIALAECCISNDKPIGVILDNLDQGIDLTTFLFSESQSRFIISCSKENLKNVIKIIEKNNTPYRVLGKTFGERLIIYNKKEAINVDVNDLKKAWEESLPKYFE